MSHSKKWWKNNVENLLHCLEILYFYCPGLVIESPTARVVTIQDSYYINVVLNIIPSLECIRLIDKLPCMQIYARKTPRRQQSLYNPHSAKLPIQVVTDTPDFLDYRSTSHLIISTLLNEPNPTYFCGVYDTTVLHMFDFRRVDTPLKTVKDLYLQTQKFWSDIKRMVDAYVYKRNKKRL